RFAENGSLLRLFQEVVNDAVLKQRRRFTDRLFLIRDEDFGFDAEAFSKARGGRRGERGCDGQRNKVTKTRQLSGHGSLHGRNGQRGPSEFKRSLCAK